MKKIRQELAVCRKIDFCLKNRELVTNIWKLQALSILVCSNFQRLFWWYVIWAQYIYEQFFNNYTF